MTEYYPKERDHVVNSPAILFMVTAASSVVFYRGVAGHLAKQGWTVHISAAPADERPGPLVAPDGVTTHILKMKREISLLSDFRSLLGAARLVRRLRPDIIVAGTPKAGLIGMVASITHPPTRRVYHCHGLRLETTTGATYRILRATERIACLFSHEVIAVSQSLRSRLIDWKLARPSKVSVVGQGSASGVDLIRFRATSRHRTQSTATSGPTLGFIGRITEDKGIPLLAESLRNLADLGIRGELLVLGADDGKSGSALRTLLDTSGWRIAHVGKVANVEDYLPLMDIVCLPTKREGFPTTVLEAAAAGRPVVATDATGVRDALIDGVTGLIVKYRTAYAYAAALRGLIEDPDLQETLGRAARDRAERHYDQSQIWRSHEAFFRSILDRRIYGVTGRQRRAWREIR